MATTAELSRTFSTSARYTGTINSSNTLTKSFSLTYQDNGKTYNIPVEDITRIVVHFKTTVGTCSAILGRVLGEDADGTRHPATPTQRSNGFEYKGSNLADLSLTTGGKLYLYCWANGCSSYGGAFGMAADATVYWADPATKVRLLVSSTSYSIIGSLSFIISNRQAGMAHKITIYKDSKTSSTNSVLGTNGYLTKSDSGIITQSWSFPYTSSGSGGISSKTYTWDDRTNTNKKTFNIFIKFQTWNTVSACTSGQDPVTEEYYAVDGKDAMVITIPAGNKTMTSSNMTFTITPDTSNTYDKTFQGITPVRFYANAIGAYGTKTTLMLQLVLSSTVNQTISSISKVNPKIDFTKPISEVGSLSYKITAIDGVGNSNYLTKSVTVTAFSPVSIMSYTANRSDDKQRSQQYIVVSYTPFTYNGTKSNYLYVKFRRQEQGSSGWMNYSGYFGYETTLIEESGANQRYAIITPNSGTTATVDKICTGTDLYDKTKTYTYEITVKDLFTTQTRTCKIGTGYIFMRWDKNKNAFGFGTYPTENKSLCISEDWKFMHGDKQFLSDSGSPYYYSAVIESGTPTIAGASTTNPKRFLWQELNQSGNFFTIESYGTTGSFAGASRILCTEACVADVNYTVYLYKDFTPETTVHTRLVKNSPTTTPISINNSNIIHGSYHRIKYAHHGQQYTSPTVTVSFKKNDRLDLDIFFAAADVSNGQGTIRSDTAFKTCLINISIKSTTL